MNNVRRIPLERVEVASKSLLCDKCLAGTWYYRESHPELGNTGHFIEGIEELAGTSCNCGGTMYIDDRPETFRKGGYYEVDCDCGDTLSIYRDGQQCKCGQMYNAVGQKITHRGYDAYGDTDDYDY